jgi:kumamolisin
LLGAARFQHLTRGEFRRKYAAEQHDLDKVVAFAADHGLQVDGVDAGKCVVKLSGPVSAMNEAFGVDLALFERSGVRFRSHLGAVHLPEELRDVVTLVVGLDSHPIARPHHWLLRTADAAQPKPGSIAEYTASELARIYRFPECQGDGHCLGIIEMCSGFFESDLYTYFAALGIARPRIVVVGPNNPGTLENPNKGYGEVVMDIEVAAAVVPKATIVVYFARENTQLGFMEVIHEAILDTTHGPEVVSVSWGNPEKAWSQAAADQMRQIIAEGALLKVTVCVASGDKGACDGEDDGKLVVDFPGSVPEALCCGGTRLVAKNSVVESEVTWNDPWWKLATGGGVSRLFPMPAYQVKAGVQPAPPLPVGTLPTGFKGRCVPDVAANADPLTGYRLYILKQWYVDGGTSAVAPLWAALIVRLNQSLGYSVGFVNPLLYGMLHRLTHAAFTDITEGDNGYYRAGPGWDACTGLGSPNGTALLKVMSEKPA